MKRRKAPHAAEPHWAGFGTCAAWAPCRGGAERPQCGRAAKRGKAPRTTVSRILKECHENSRNFRAARRGANGANERSEGTCGRRQASRLRLSLAFGARKNARSSPPSAKKNGYRSFWSRRASAQPTAGRPLAGRPEAVRGARKEVIDGLLDELLGNCRMTGCIARHVRWGRPSRAARKHCSPGGWGEGAAGARAIASAEAAGAAGARADANAKAASTAGA